VTNASEAIGETQGVIRIRTWPAAGQSLRETGWSNDGCVQLEISDTGCGMSPETQTRMFEPFFSTKSAGRGLGLAVVEGIVRSLGGTIELESRPGSGTTMRVSLPLLRTSGGQMDVQTTHAICPPMVQLLRLLITPQPTPVERRALGTPPLSCIRLQATTAECPLPRQFLRPYAEVPGGSSQSSQNNQHTYLQELSTQSSIQFP
jgi:hypothetical protein